MISLLVAILVLCLVFGVILYIIRLLPIPEPFGQVATIIVALILVLLLIDMLMGGRFVGFRLVG